MADVAVKRGTLPGGVSVREQLRALDDSAVVAAFLGGEERAFQELVDRYQTRLLNFVYRTIGDREKAEDLVQEVFIRVYRHLHRFDASKKFSTWIYTIASNLAKNELRNRSRNPLVLFQTITKHWQVFVLRELEGKSYEEIAEITNCNLGTVKSRLNRARNSFAEIIEPWLK